MCIPKTADYDGVRHPYQDALLLVIQYGIIELGHSRRFWEYMSAKIIKLSKINNVDMNRMQRFHAAMQLQN